jgi:nitrogen fixation protein FixH
MHWAPKLLISFFVGLVFLNAALLYLSTKGLPEPIARWWLGHDGRVVYTGFSGEVAHGQNAAKAVSSELSETHRESLLGWQVDVSGLDGSGLTRLVEVRVKDRTGLPVDRVVAELRLKRPGAPVAALTLQLNVAESGVYIGSLALPASGRWLLDVQLKRDGDRQYHSILEVNVP